jgi:SAM-dependent methyltransferase
MEKYVYNGVWLDGKLEKEGYRPSEERYEQISKFCKQYSRPFSVLDIGAAEGYFTHRLASEFDGCFTAVESDKGRNLLETCKKNNNDKVFLLEKKINLKDLKAMAEVHYFDVILALNVVHHFDEPFQEVLDTMMSMCSYCFFEHPDEKEDKKTINFERLAAEKLNLDKYNAEYLIDTDRWEAVSRKLYLLENKSPKKVARRWSKGKFYKDDEGIDINTSFENIKVSYKHKDEERDWRLGLNLRTFFENDGAYPTLYQIFEQIDTCEVDEDNKTIDLASHNLILDNGRVDFIDQGGGPDYDNTKYFYINEKEIFKAHLLMSFPRLQVPSEVYEQAQMQRGILQHENIKLLTILSESSGKTRIFSTMGPFSHDIVTELTEEQLQQKPL